jgi:hypothetical protein
MLRQSRNEGHSTWVLLAAVVVAATACGERDKLPVVEGVIDRETFIAAYVDLRAETLGGSELTLSDDERDEVLARHGADAEGLEAFVDAYGRELDFMNGVWTEVERLLEARPTPPPEAGGLSR